MNNDTKTALVAMTFRPLRMVRLTMKCDEVEKAFNRRNDLSAVTDGETGRGIGEVWEGRRVAMTFRPLRMVRL